MKKLVLFFLILTAGYSYGARKDSIGLDQQNGRAFILHKVDPKETLFALSRRYQVSIEDILKNNPEAREGVKIAAILKIPYSQQAGGQRDHGRYHTVQPSETLFSISRQYDVDVETLLKVNNLADHSIKPGQRLEIPGSELPEASPVAGKTAGRKTHVVSEGETLYSIAKAHQVSVDQLKAWNDLPNNNVKIGQMLAVSAQKKVQIDEEIVGRPDDTANATASISAEPVKKYEINDNEYAKAKRERKTEAVKIEKVYETGLAEAIEGSGDTKKYLALHRTAPVGSILQVRNEMNNLSVFVRVIGKLPDTGDNRKIKIKISQTAYDHLGAIDPRFPVEISYIP